MQITVHPALQRFTNGQAQLELAACTIDQLLPKLQAQAPALARCIMDNNSRLQPYVALFINNKALSEYAPDDWLENDTQIDILSSLVGG